MSLGHGASLVRNGLVLHLDAANYKSYPNSGTTWFDLSGKNNDLSSSSLTYSSAENAMNIQTANLEVTLSTPVDKYSFTYNYWFRPFAAPLGDWRSIARFYDTNNITYFNIDTRQVATPSVLHYVKDYTLAAWDTYALYNNSTYNAYEWHCGTLVMESSSSWKTYLDGSLLGTTPVTKNLSPYTSIAKVQTTAPSVYLSNIMMYNRPLSSTEVKQNFEAMRGRFAI